MRRWTQVEQKIQIDGDTRHFKSHCPSTYKWGGLIRQSPWCVPAPKQGIPAMRHSVQQLPYQLWGYKHNEATRFGRGPPCTPAGQIMRAAASLRSEPFTVDWDATIVNLGDLLMRHSSRRRDKTEECSLHLLMIIILSLRWESLTLIDADAALTSSYCISCRMRSQGCPTEGLPEWTVSRMNYSLFGAICA